MASVPELLALVDRSGVSRATDLARLLQVGQPQVSRLIRAAGSAVARTGKARSTRYALTRTVRGLGPALPLHSVDAAGTARRVGVVHLLARGRHWFEDASTGSAALFAGLPPSVQQMGPDGYLGQVFASRNPELGLPSSLADWSDDDRLVALARRGEDCPGALILGSESLDRYLARTPTPVERKDYPELARRSLEAQPLVWLGGAQPRFGAFCEGRHVLVKFTASDDSVASRRWRDLLVCEAIALDAVRASGLEAPLARAFDAQGSRFLELERFDREGTRGRRAVLSLAGVADLLEGHRESWTRAAARLHALGRLSDADARRVRWLDVFGQLIGNNRRHLGNLSLRAEPGQPFTLAPVHDMLPMFLAPAGSVMHEQSYEPQLPTAETLDVWPDAARAALGYWGRIAELGAVSKPLHRIAERCCETLERALLRFAPGG